VNEIGSLNLSTGLNQTMGFDIAPNGVALAAITFSGDSRLYTINLNTGQAVLNGTIGNGNTPYRGLAIRKGPEIFTNSGVILLPAAGGTGGPGFEKANPYPSIIAISNLTLPVLKLKVTLHDFRHSFPDDVDMLLFAPSQVGAPQQKMIIWSDVGGGTSTCGSNCNNGANPGTTGPTITLDDEAQASLPDTSLLTNGTFKPTNFVATDPFPVPAPVPPYAEAAPAGSDTFKSVFRGVSPNGTWSLYVVDEDDMDTGRIFGGWSLEMTTAPPCTIACPGNITVGNSPNQCGAFVFPSRPTVSGACGTLVSSPPAGSLFPIGTTTVTTTTSSGESCTFNVTVNDTQNPTIACNANITKPADPGQNSTIVNFDPPTIGDNCPGATGVYSPASGSFFALGTTTVTGTATDTAGHTATCTFTVTITPNGGPSPTPPPGATPTPGATSTPGATPTPGPTSTPVLPPSYLANISTRLRVETGDNVLIGGFIITGSQAKRLIVRAIGSSLPLANRLANPKLELYSGNNLLETNDNWQDASNAQEILATQLAPTNDLESAILRTLNPGAYTAIVSGVSGGTGVALVETYDLSPDINSRLANIATRGFVQTGDDIMIAGTIVVGQVSQRVVVRAIGPSLPLAGKLENPTLELRDGNGTLLVENDDWRSTQEAEIIGTGLQPTNNLESAIVRVLPPALYTALLRGVNGTTGIAVVEVYAIN
jgi:hypothetical protein